MIGILGGGFCEPLTGKQIFSQRGFCHLLIGGNGISCSI
jgi:hypothetical protein